MRSLNRSRLGRQIVKLALCFLLGILILLIPGLQLQLTAVPSQAIVEQNTATTEQGIPNRQELESFMDEFFAEQMEELHVPGATVALVKDGEVFFTKGYGYADIDKQMAVTPDQTVFRVGSVSKLFTATAIMQLVDRGLLNVEDDVNKYLQDFQIESTYPDPIRVRHLLTHTSGFSQHYIGIAARSEAERLSLAEYVEEYQPPRVRPAGELYSYSTYDSDLAGYIVEVVSGVSYEEYVTQNILQPLDMQRSTFSQTLPEQLATNLATGYEYEDDSYETTPYLYLNIVPAGGMSTTATDMTHFMLAHLQNGRYGEQRILSEKSAQEMRQQQFTDHPKLPGIGYAFHERFKNRQRILAHSAIFLGYTGLLSLIPDQDLGLFIAYNKFDPKFHERLTSQFLDRFYPVAEAEVPQPLANHHNRLRLFTGTYRDFEYPEHTIAKISSLFNHVSVNAKDDGTLEVHFPEGFFATIPPQDNFVRLLEVEPLIFYRYNDDDFVVFEQSDRGNITHMYHPLDLGPAGFEKLPWYETTYFHIPLAIFFLIAFLSAIWVGIRNIIQRRSQSAQQHKPMASWAWLVAGLVSLLYLVFPISMGLALLLNEPTDLIYGVPLIMVALLWIPIVAALISILLPIFAVLVWQKQYWSWWGRLHYSIITVAILGFIPFLDYWNLLGFRF
ncbi:hypothetical protein NIES1031_22815 [Chroogloeocystis siderophila 5.2 s.c.1]|uniref:Beta-lactamase-related domain-containing protein n=2 Tax=Chroogloeocystis TaxID=329162 RepID=A0A1U7HB53_9CHRO|nr:hypothetical protein NIES1031_22815 [Chroogloeocystis siderophila 5.2 s.c.1]